MITSLLHPPFYKLNVRDMDSMIGERKKSKMLKCQYCGGFATLQDSSRVYGKSYGNIFLCLNYPRCDSFVGVHKKTNKPLGILASKYLRELRKECHWKFDKFWKKELPRLELIRERRKAYKWLAHTMGVSSKKAHIAKFNEEQCLELLKHF